MSHLRWAMTCGLVPLTMLLITGATSALSAQQPDSMSLRVVLRRADDALTARRLDEAISLYKRCLRLAPRDSSCAYNIACAYSLKHDAANAVEWFARSADWGFDDVEHILKDSDLDNIRSEAGYRRIVEDLQRRLPDSLPRRELFPPDHEAGLDLVVMLRSELGSGAGIVLSHQGSRVFVATADHVVRRGGDAKKIEVQFKGLAPRWVTARLLPPIADSTLDVAILAVDGIAGATFDFCALPLRLAETREVPRRGSVVYPVGYPGGTLWAMPQTADRVSQVIGSQISFESQFVRVGFSGGGLFNERGQLVGMIVADEPPFARAVPLALVLQAARQATYPVQLQSTSAMGGDPLRAAIKAGDLAGARAALDECADPNALSGSGRTALHDAAERASAEMVRLLLDRGARSNAWALLTKNSDASEWGTPLHFAAAAGKVEAIRALLTPGSDVDLPTLWRGEKPETYQWRTALHIAIEHDAADAVDGLLAAGANVNEKNFHDETPIAVAAKYGSVRAARVLLRHGAAVRDSDENRSPLNIAAERGDTEMLKLLVENGGRVNVGGGGATPLMVAAQNGRVDAVRFLIEKKADVNAKGYRGRTALHVAAEKGSSAVVKLLLASGADVNGLDEGGLTALEFAVEQGDLQTVRALVAAKAEIGTALHRALGRKNIGAARVLMEGRVDVALRDSRGRQPLHVAAILGLVDAVDLLLKAGAPVNAYSPSSDSGTSLHLAAEAGHQLVVDRLIAAGASINAFDAYHRTALYRAVESRHTEVVARLLRAHADPNLAAGSSYAYMGHLPITQAVRGPSAILGLLLDAGADPNRVDDGITALTLAAESDDPSKVRMLLKAGARPSAEDGKISPLHWAARVIRSDSVSTIIELLIAAHARIEATDDAGRTPLLVAAINRNADATRTLAAKGANVRAVDHCGRTALWLALDTRDNVDENKLLALAESLVAAGAEVNPTDSCAKTTLLDQVEQNGKVALRRFLTAKGAKSRRSPPLRHSVR